MKTCPDCGCRVYSLGCVNCNESDYIEEQETLDEQKEREPKHAPPKEPPLPDGRLGR